MVPPEQLHDLAQTPVLRHVKPLDVRVHGVPLGLGVLSKFAAALLMAPLTMIGIGGGGGGGGRLPGIGAEGPAEEGRFYTACLMIP